MKTALISASHKVSKSNCKYLISLLASHMDKSSYSTMSLVGKNKEMTLNHVNDYENIVIFTPIYIDLPSSECMAFIEDLVNKKTEESMIKNLYVVSNCGFYDKEHNSLCIEYFKLFCEVYNITFKGSLSIGAGELILSTSKYPKIHRYIIKDIEKKLAKMAANFGKEEIFGSYYINLKLPRFIYKFISVNYWVYRARLNKLEEEDMYKSFQE